MLLNCGAGEDYWEFLGLQGDPTSQSPKGSQPWIFTGRTDTLATWCKEPTHWTRLWYWERLKAKGERRWILKEINPEYSLEGLMLKLQYFRHLMWSGNSLEKTLMLGKIEGKRRGWERMRWLIITDSVGMNLSKLWDIVKERAAWHAAALGLQRVRTWLSKWTTRGTLCQQPVAGTHIYFLLSHNTFQMFFSFNSFIYIYIFQRS